MYMYLEAVEKDFLGVASINALVFVLFSSSWSIFVVWTVTGTALSCRCRRLLSVFVVEWFRCSVRCLVEFNCARVCTTHAHNYYWLQYCFWIYVKRRVQSGCTAIAPVGVLYWRAPPPGGDVLILILVITYDISIFGRSCISVVLKPL